MIEIQCTTRLSDQTATLRQTLEYVNLTLDVFGRLRLACETTSSALGSVVAGPRDVLDESLEPKRARLRSSSRFQCLNTSVLSHRPCATQVSA